MGQVLNAKPAYLNVIPVKIIIIVLLVEVLGEFKHHIVLVRRVMLMMALTSIVLNAIINVKVAQIQKI